MIQVIKRNSRGVEPFDLNKIVLAVSKAQLTASDSDINLPLLVAYQVKYVLSDDELVDVTVDEIHTLVENTLMDLKKYDVAREYITYRKSHMPDIFRPRQTYRPYEYPEMIDFIDAIHASFWTHRSFNLDSSVQDIRVNMPKHHATAVLRSILSIASVEAKVKSFWGGLGDRFPKSEFEELGTTIGSNEVYHAHFYAKVLDDLNQSDMFKEALQTPAMRKRINYMTRSLEGRNGSNQDYTKSLIFFSLFVENVSLFSQFLTISVINKELNQVTGLAHGISATMLEETLHAEAGASIVNIIRKQNPEWFTDSLNEEVLQMVHTAFEAERDIIDWIFELGEFEFLPKASIIEYIKYRTNSGLLLAGFNAVFAIDDSLIEPVNWFELQTKTTMHRDFFAGHSVNYDKNSLSFSEEDLF